MLTLRPSRLTAMLAGLSLTTSALGAQVVEREQGSRVRYLALNVVIGTTASVARSMVSGTPLRQALVKGLVGGSMMSAGMQLVGMDSPATRFAGLQLTAVGASVSRNVDAGTPALADITLPVYPFYVRVRPGASSPVTARLSAMSTARLVSVLASKDRPSMDWGQTLASGAPVLRSPLWRLPSSTCPAPCEGSYAQHSSGVIVYSASAGTDYDLRRTLAHESIHLAQQTRDALLNAIPVSDAMLERGGPVGRGVSRFFVMDVLMPLRFIDEGEARMRGAVRRESWYEREARAFAPGGQLR